jgi:methanethiol S-methyltransferase
VPEYFDFILRMTLFCILHSLLAVPRIKERIQRLNSHLRTGYRFTYNLFSMLMFFWVMLAWQSTSVLFFAPGIWSLILHALQFLVLWAGFICLRQTGLLHFLGVDLRQKSEPSALTTTGCYAVVRHPLYLLGILLLLLNPVVTTRWIALTLFSIPYMIFGALLEERRMLRHLGATYAAYQRNVPFLIPRLNRQISTD